MTLLQIAADLYVVAVPVITFVQGADFSQPVAMLDAGLVRVSGVVQRIVGTDFEFAAIVQGSNDLSTWQVAHVEPAILGTRSAPFSFAFGGGSGIAVPYAYARAWWLLYPTAGDPPVLLEGSAILFSAHLSTGRQGD